MSTVNTIINIFFSSLSVLINMISYGKLARRKMNYSIKNILIIIVCGFLIVLNTNINTNLIRIITTFMLLIISSKLIFKDSFYKSIFYVLITYFLIMFYEIILSSIVLATNMVNVQTFDSSIVIKNLFSIIIVLMVLLTARNKKFNSRVNKIADKININKRGTIINILSILLVLISLVIIDFKYARNIDSKVYIGNIVVMVCIIAVLISCLYNYFNATNEMEKSDILLNFMTKYEKIIDEDRINRHEMLNNLLFLKSFKDKNSSEYNEALDDLVTSYNKKCVGIKNIFNLPTGLKGIFYYKLNGLDENGFNINVKISKNISNSFKSINHKDYVILYKAVGVLLDNAIEAAEKTKEKLINIDIYKEKSSIIIIIDNSFKGNVKMSKISEKNYSTKDKNRGLGLFILNNLIKDNNSIKLEQSIDNNIFTSKIIVYKKKN